MGGLLLGQPLARQRPCGRQPFARIDSHEILDELDSVLGDALAAEFAAREWLGSMTIAIQQTGIERGLDDGHTRGEPRVSAVRVEEGDFQRQHLVHDRAESPDVDVVRVRVSCCSELAREDPELLWSAINSRAAVRFQ